MDNGKRPTALRMNLIGIVALKNPPDAADKVASPRVFDEKVRRTI